MIPASDIFASVLTAYMLYRQKQIFKSRIALETEALDKEEKLIEEIENE